jgi:hypothetical protein
MRSRRFQRLCLPALVASLLLALLAPSIASAVGSGPVASAAKKCKKKSHAASSAKKKKKKCKRKRAPTPVTAIPPVTAPPTTPPKPPTPPLTPSQQIGAARATPDGPADVHIGNVLVTYLKPSVGSESAGFFVQAAQHGPALFVAIDPATLTPSPAVGDRVSFTVTLMGTMDSVREAVSIASFTRSATGVDVSPLEQNVSGATNLVSGLTGYEAELLNLDGTVSGSFFAAGTGHTEAAITTSGYPSGDPNLRLRLPQTLEDTVQLVDGCDFSVHATPMWRFDAKARVSAWTSADLTVLSCPFQLSSALATSATSVVVSFNRNVDAASVNSNGSQFAIPGLTVSAAVVSGNQVTLTTSLQSNGTSYTVTGENTLTDQLGDSLQAGHESTGFTGF